MTKDQKDTPKKDSNDQGGPRRLLRSPKERVLTGVGGGLGDYLGVDPTFVRLGFVAATLFGGFGVLAYLVMAVVVPEDDGTGNPVTGRRPPIWALVLLGIAVLIALPFGWGGHGWWWGFTGPLWIGLLILAGYWAYRMISGRPISLSGGGDRPKAAASKGTVSKGTASKAAASKTAANEVSDPPRFIRGLAIVLLAAAGVMAALAVAAVSVWATATGSGAAIAGVVIALGVALAATAFFTDARRTSAPWLLALALVLALPAGAVAAADIRFDGGVGEREYTPTSVADIPAEGYELGIGRLVVDLRDLPWKEGEVVPVRSELGIGQMVVSVPENVCVVGRADAKAGELLVRGDSNSGVDPEFDRGAPTGSKAPRLEFDGELQLGQLAVTDQDPDRFEDNRDRDGDDAEEAAAAQAACDR